VATSNPGISKAKTTTEANPLQNLVEAQETLDTLLTNYQRATIDCTFADVPRELLETKNKELLLEKAATNALFDKSASIETCKTTNRIVRDYLGVTGKGMFAILMILLNS
jgi:23S rRNA U2552 (ribose-2'-O)-methylase RlmE/FtsJ